MKVIDRLVSFLIRVIRPTPPIVAPPINKEDLRLRSQWQGYELDKDDWFAVITPKGDLLDIDHLENLDDYGLDGGYKSQKFFNLFGVRFYNGGNRVSGWYLFDNYDAALFFGEEGTYPPDPDMSLDELYAKTKAKNVPHWQ